MISFQLTNHPERTWRNNISLPFLFWIFLSVPNIWDNCKSLVWFCKKTRNTKSIQSDTFLLKLYWLYWQRKCSFCRYLGYRIEEGWWKDQTETWRRLATDPSSSRHCSLEMSTLFDQSLWFFRKIILPEGFYKQVSISFNTFIIIRRPCELHVTVIGIN